VYDFVLALIPAFAAEESRWHLSFDSRSFTNKSLATANNLPRSPCHTSDIISLTVVAYIPYLVVSHQHYPIIATGRISVPPAGASTFHINPRRHRCYEPFAMVSPTISTMPPQREPPRPPPPAVIEAEMQWIFTEEELLLAPSITDGMPAEEERTLRRKGVNFILQVGMMLKLPQTTLSTAAVFFNRYLMRASLKARPGYKPLHQYVSLPATESTRPVHF